MVLQELFDGCRLAPLVYWSYDWRGWLLAALVHILHYHVCFAAEPVLFEIRLLMAL